jgi:hypothetical protein
MEESHRLKLAEKHWQAKDIGTVKEIVRLGESFLNAQLQAALASDLRAMTLAAVLAAVIAGTIGGAATVLAANIVLGLHIIPLIVFIVAMVVALRMAIHAAHPTRFDYAGNNPKFWADDVGDYEDLKRALAEQAAYAKGVEQNGTIIK